MSEGLLYIIINIMFSQNAALVSQAFFLAFSAKGKLLFLLQKLQSIDDNICNCNLKPTANHQQLAVLNTINCVQKSAISASK